VTTMNPHEQKAVVESVSGGKLVLKLDDGGSLSCSAQNAPSTKPGDKVVVRILTETQATTDRHEQARVVLKELLGGEQ
jgi:hypothetical protein